MGMDVGGSSTTRSDINVTPLVDVVLVLLIIFMVMTPLMEKEMAVRVPEKQEAEVMEAVPEDQIVVTLWEDGRIFINKERIPDADFPRRLGNVMRATSERIAFFNASDGVTYEEMIALIDRAKDNGVVTVAMITEDPKDPELFEMVPEGLGAPE